MDQNGNDLDEYHDPKQESDESETKSYSDDSMPTTKYNIKFNEISEETLVNSRELLHTTASSRFSDTNSDSNYSPETEHHQKPVIFTYQIYESGHLNKELNMAKLCPKDGEDLKLLMLITSAPQHFDARLAIRETWGTYSARRDISTAFMLGRSLNNTLNLALVQENYIYGDLIRGNFIDSYDNLTLKTVSALEWVDQHCARAKYVLKTDDDMFINVPNLLKHLDKYSKKTRVLFGRLVRNWKTVRNEESKYHVSIEQYSAPVLPPFLTGPAYIISGDVIHELYVELLRQTYLKLEDVITTGIVAKQLQIERFNVAEMVNEHVKHKYCIIRNLISIHEVSSSKLFNVWLIVHNQNIKCNMNESK